MSGEQNIEREETIKQKIADLKKKYLLNCEKRVKISHTINYGILKKLEIDERKSKAHEVFKWILVAMYIEP